MTEIVAVEAYAGQLSEAAQRSLAAAALQHLFVHGRMDESLPTESGPLPTLAKWQHDNLLPNQEAFAQLRAIIDAVTADPANAVTSWELQAKGFDLVQGGATYGVITSRLGAWSFPAGSASYISMPLALPSHWTLVDVYVKWVNVAANAGNVVLGGEIHRWAVGESINQVPAGGSSIIAANPGPWLVTESKVAANLVIDPARSTTLRLARQGGSSNDTLPNSLAIVSIRIQKK
jgi:hypothetical protein